MRKRKRLKFLFSWINLDYLAVNFFLFLSVAVLGALTFNISVFDPIKKALSDFNFSDLLYSRLSTTRHTLDTNLVLVNIGHLDRAGIAGQIKRIREHNPKVIGFDSFFSARRDSVTDAFLADQLKEGDNFFMACFLTGKDALTGQFDSLETSFPYFNSGNKGFVNLGGAHPETSTVRFFSPREVFKGDTLFSLGAALVKRYDPEAFAKLMKRNNRREIINYRGNIDTYIGFDVYELFDSATDLSIVKNKIVLMGYMGDSFQGPPDLEDIYYTPMNPALSGRSRPDMYGVVIHANIISMILGGNYINIMPVWLCILLSFILCYFYIAFITWLGEKNPLLSNLIFPVFLLTLNVLLIYLFFLIYKYLDYSINSGFFLAPLLLYKTFLTYYERVLLVINRKIKIHSRFLPKK